MAIGFRDSANAGGSGTSINVASGDVTGLADGDFLVAVVFLDDQSAATITGPGGWTKPAALDTADSSARQRQVAIFYKIASGETGNWTFSQDGAADNMAAVVNAFTGVDQSTSIDVTPIAGHVVSGQNDDTPDPASITTVTNSAWVMTYCGMNGNSSSHTSVTVPTNYTERGTEPDPYAASNQRQIATATREITTAGAENPGVWTFSGGTANVQDYIVGVLAIRPASDGASDVNLTGANRGIARGVARGVG